MGFLTDSTHLHITTWVIGLILFFIAATGISKSKGIHMVLRLFYILILISGGALFFKWRVNFEYDIKFLLGILLIAMMEMILVRQAKNKPTNVFWVLFFIFLFATLFFGLRLQMGFDLF
ncbi:UPF0344 protein YisL [Lysinibacillus sp. PLM2]|nr:UPF0344 protein YisL [Lysinibacillus sp. PLM2]